VLAVPLLLGVAAVREFAAAGGTPLPYDPPARLVTTGPYAYVRNPMQTSMAGAYLLLSVLDPWFLAAALIAVAYGAGLASWHEGEDLASRYGAAWRAYHRQVRPWLPRRRPYPGMTGGVAYVAATCGQCRGLARWVRERRPVALRIRPAEDHPAGLRRMTYERGDGVRAEGVAALAHVLQHLHLGWALAGWFLLLPGAGRFAQLCADAFGAGPRHRPHPDGAERADCRDLSLTPPSPPLDTGRQCSSGRSPARPGRRRPPGPRRRRPGWGRLP
jgi:hypothetical protein